jgi:hemoglobin-like flavoprotein
MSRNADDQAVNSTMRSYDRWLVWHHASRRLRTVGPPASRGMADWGDQALIEASLGVVAPRALELVDAFYRQLFIEYPHMRQFFPPDMTGQSDRLLAAILALATGVNQPTALLATLEQLGRDHRKFGIRPVHFAAVGKTLLDTLARFAGTAWTPEIETAWLDRYQAAADVMLAAAEAAEDKPPYWYAVVVDQQPVTVGVATMTVRPHEPYHFVPGQSATIESPRLPRVWRPFPITGQPHPNGLVTFTVTRGATGDLGDVLVNVTTVGETLRIGSPLDSTTIVG